MRSGFVTVHGIDGTGKSTLASTLAASLTERGHRAFEFDALPELAGVARSPQSHRRPNSIEKKQTQSHRINHFVQDGITVVRDRWLIDVLASNAWEGRALPVDTHDVAVPDLSILLLCAESERMERVSKRGNPTPDDLIPNIHGTRAHAFQTYLLEHLPDLSHNQLVIDTTAQRPEVVAQVAVNEVMAL